MFLFDRKEAPFWSKLTETQTTVVEKVASLTITSPKISKQSYNTLKVNYELRKKRETNYWRGIFMAILGTLITAMQISKKPYTIMNIA